MSATVAKRVLDGAAPGTAPATVVLAYIGRVEDFSAGIAESLKVHFPEVESAEELLLMLKTSVAMAGGTTGSTLVRFQRKVDPILLDTNDAAWQDFYAVDIATTIVNRGVVFPVPIMANADQLASYNEDLTALATDIARTGHWGDRIRIIAVVTGDRTTGATFSVAFSVRAPERRE